MKILNQKRKKLKRERINIPPFFIVGEIMLENIKALLNITKNDYDSLIELYIKKVTKRVKGYCNIEDFLVLPQIDQDAINEFIEDKVANIMAYKLSALGENVDDSSTSTPANQGAIKSITRGSVRIEYNYDSVSSESISNSNTKTSPELTDEEMKILNKYRKLRF